MEYIGNILYDELLLKGNQKIIIFGAGTYGRKILEYLEFNGAKNNIAGFCDSNEAFQGKCIEGFPVYSPKNAFLLYPGAQYLISGRYIKEMYEILKENNIAGVHILFI